jgi:hypothetical protein
MVLKSELAKWRACALSKKHDMREMVMLVS